MSQPIQPLRIQKNTPQSSPNKMAQRPLTELGPMERRRNSPSFNQNTKKPLLDSSPFDTSPFGAKFNTSPFATNSPRAYWQTREPTSPVRYSMENQNPREGSPSPSKRPSVENLKKASRVKNSTMFAREQKQEYDPTSVPLVERPLAAGRPLSAQAQYMTPPIKQENTLSSSPLKSPAKLTEPELPKPGPPSPGKSSLSKNSRYGRTFDPENGAWSEEEEDSFVDRQLPAGKSLHRHAKSVTFDVAPPQVNEYEMTTPDPSSVASGSREGSYESAEDEEDDEESFERSGSMDRDDSFDASLEDTDKTPVVLPEDWRFMSPAAANDELTARMEDPFDVRDGSPAPGALPVPVDARNTPSRTGSLNSNGERRPLPPLPPSGFATPSANGPTDLSAGLPLAADSASAGQRSLPSPPRPASVTKNELQSIGTPNMPIEDRMRLMMLDDDEKAQATRSAAEEQRERRMRRAGGSPDRTYEKSPSFKIHEDATDSDDTTGPSHEQVLPRISRESILRKVKSQNFKDDYHSSPIPSPRQEPLEFRNIVDPDIPIPSLEAQLEASGADEDVKIKQEEDLESEVDVYAIPDMYRQDSNASKSSNAGFDFGLDAQENQPPADDDDESHYSTDLNESGLTKPAFPTEDEGPPTPKADHFIAPSAKLAETAQHRLSLSQFASMLGEDDFGLSLSSYMTPSPPAAEPTKLAKPFVPEVATESAPEPIQARPFTPVEKIEVPTANDFSFEEDESKTPESVIRRSMSDPSSIELEAPSVPEPSATIKAPGGKLRTRPSLAPADVQTMAETRRQVSGETPAIPPIPQRHQNRPSVIPEADSFMPDETFEDQEADSSGKQAKRRSSLVQLEVPLEEVDEGLSFGIDKEFDRLIEAQKKGYLMRQNTKMVVASSASHESATDSHAEQEPHLRGTRSAGNSPVKQSPGGTWKAEPWNGKMRRKSIRQSAGSPMKPPPSGPAPPLPGMSSNVSYGLDSVAESEAVPELEEFDESGERGRLFVKVVGVKDIDLPLPRGERSYFSLTLDNGLHCVTTAWLELGKNAPIGQEFELVVLSDLEFQLTLKTKIEEPKPAVKAPDSPTKKIVKPSTFSRVFASPKKRREQELKQQEEAQKAAKQRDLEAKNKRLNPSAWDLLHNLVDKDGSFARSYISLKEHENRAYGRPYVVDIPCFNEWAMEDARGSNSSRASRTTPAAPNSQRKAPYKIGKLELQLLYVPKPKDARDEDMPKSMNACVRELVDAEQTLKQTYEGHLSQQGGDCPYWRRRFFRLEGAKLTAYHEATHQPRATINLAKASKLIDDKSALTKKEVAGKGGARRRSAFAAEEEGYMFVEEGFRVRFANGETIDFYADSTAEKEGWMGVLAQVVGRDNKAAKSWTDIVLQREKAMGGGSSNNNRPSSSAMRPGSGSGSGGSRPGSALAGAGAGTANGRASPTKSATSATTSAATPQLSPRKSSKTQHTSSPSRPISHQMQQQQRPNSSDKALPRPGGGPGTATDPRRMSAADRRLKTRSMVF